MPDGFDKALESLDERVLASKDDELNPSKRALIFGIGGQGGSYLAEILLDQGYEIHGLVRHSSVDNLVRIRHLLDKVTLHRGDFTDANSVERSIFDSQPDEVYNLADQDAVNWSRTAPNYQYNVTFSAVGQMLELIRSYITPRTKIFQPVSATMFQGAPYPQNESTPLTPQSPYACAKAGAFHLCRYYRETHGMFVSCGIMFNHDSPRRSEDYLVHKICRSALRIARGEQETLSLGNLEHLVDVGHAREFMGAAVAMLQRPFPADYVIATGVPHSIGELAVEAIVLAEHRRSKTELKEIITENPDYTPKGGKVHPPLIGDITKAQAELGFFPRLHGRELVKSIIGELP